jgi:hypothetical protein
MLILPGECERVAKVQLLSFGVFPLLRDVTYPIHPLSCLVRPDSGWTSIGNSQERGSFRLSVQVLRLYHPQFLHTADIGMDTHQAHSHPLRCALRIRPSSFLLVATSERRGRADRL